MNNVIIISLCVALIIIVIIIAILLYNQMLLLNEYNKRLLLLAKESIEKERSTQEELTEALRQQDALANELNNQHPITVEQTQEEEEEIFDPHTFNE